MPALTKHRSAPSGENAAAAVDEGARAKIRIGCAGWSLARQYWPSFPESGSHLERYAGRFDAVEINSSFYRPHKRGTYVKWAASVPESFRFSVKTPRTLTHETRLVNPGEILDGFFDDVAGLGGKLGCVLVQLPASFAFDMEVVGAFFEELRRRYAGTVVLEPRHRGWFTVDADTLLRSHQVARAAADPAVVPDAALPGGCHGTAYFRLHGSPRMYYSNYSPEYLERVALDIAAEAQRRESVWCIFDNTAEGAAVGNALEVMARIKLGRA